MTEENQSIRIGISACLLGEQVRYDGGHKRSRYITDILSRYFEWIPVCPEVELGLGTPRDPIRLENIDGTVRLRMPAENLDLTNDMHRYATRRIAALQQERLSGYILKSKSPSCGMERVTVFRGRGRSKKAGRGLFAQVLLERFPHLPVEEEGRLCDPRLRENWIERVFAYHDLQHLWRPRWTIGDLVGFHTRYKLVLLAHSRPAYERLGRLVAEADDIPRNTLRERYTAEFMETLSQLATVRKNTNVLRQVLGYFKQELDPESRHELLSRIEEYRQGIVPLIVPLTLVSHYARLLNVESLRGQAYFNPHPRELALRNHV